MIPLLLALLQATPPAATVGDTVWAVRTVAAPAGAVVRPGAWPEDRGADVEALGPPLVHRDGDSVEIRYPLVAWAPGTHTVDVPGPLLVYGTGRVDSLPPLELTLAIASVLPDTVVADSAPIQPMAGAVVVTERHWGPFLALSLLGLALALGALVLGRRRGKAFTPPAPPPIPRPDVVGWAEAGEWRAAAAGALARLRAVAGTARARDARLELEGLIGALEAERFAPDDGDPDLVEQAVALARRLEGEA